MEKFDDDDDILRYIKRRKVAQRFLKEIGLWNSWKRYVKGNEFRKISINKWYITERIDNIFGRTLFTNFVNQENALKPPLFDSISNMFRTYLNVMHKNEFRLSFPDRISNNVIIDKKNHTIKIKNNYHSF